MPRANVLGGRLKSTLESLRTAVPQIAEVRGLGAMLAVEFCQAGKAAPPFRILRSKYKPGRLNADCCS